MAYTLEDDQKDSARRLLNSLTPEERLAGLTIEQRLTGLTPEEVLTHYEPKQRLAGLTFEQRLAGLSDRDGKFLMELVAMAALSATYLENEEDAG